MQELEIKDLIEKARTLVKKNSELIEELSTSIKKYARTVQPAVLDNLRVVGIDGGMIKKSYSFFDIVLLRSIGVEFYFKNNKLENVLYHPSAQITPKIVFFEKFEHEEQFSIKASYLRELDEKKLLLECSRHKPDLLIAHGSIVPHNIYADQVTKDEIYLNLIDTIKELTRIGSSVVCGVVEDSRGRIFSRYLSQMEDIDIPPMSDVSLLSQTLKVGTRTVCIDYAQEQQLLRVFQSLEIPADRIKVFYVKTGVHDLPLRVEFVARKPSECEDVADYIASVLLSLSASSNYSMPSVLIEADMRARIKNDEAKMILKPLENNVFLRMRRNRRPV